MSLDNQPKKKRNILKYILFAIVLYVIYSIGIAVYSAVKYGGN